MRSLLSQPDPIIEKIQSYLDTCSATRLEATHPELQRSVSKSNRYWKDSFVREAAKGHHDHLSHDRFSARLEALKIAHPNSAPKGYWKARYRDEIAPVIKYSSGVGAALADVLGLSVFQGFLRKTRT